MKSLYTSLFLCLCGLTIHAQQGLEQIIVEKYYVTNEADKSVDGDGGELPVDAVTYRVFVDMQPGYIFQAAFGTPAHELKIATTTRFFNNEDRGARHPTYTRSQAQNNTVMLDSWLSVGGGMKDHAGVLKTHDTGENTIQNADGVLQNQHLQAGIPLTTQDGVVAAMIEPVTVVGFFDTDLAVLDDANDMPAPVVISTHDGAWSSLNGSMGPDTAENIVLIGQFTTEGIFEFELNLQIRNQTTLGVETYVARNATGTEILFPTLIHIDSLGVISANHDLVRVNHYVSVYPNPGNGPITISIDPVIDLSAYKTPYILKSLDGVSHYSGEISDHESTLHLDLTPGMYTLAIELENKYLFTTQVVVVR